jgi:hypothetical protein
MNTAKNYGIISAASLLSGILFFALYNQWIIIKLPSFAPLTTSTSLINKKKITLHFFHQDKWKTETQDQLWTDSVTKNLSQLINSWLIVLDDERIITKKTVLQSALLSQSGTAYISFDHNVLPKEDPIYKKWMIIEGLLKTIRSNEIPIQQVQFLIQHQQLNDPHLDFSMPWPVYGFIK